MPMVGLVVADREGDGDPYAGGWRDVKVVWALLIVIALIVLL